MNMSAFETQVSGTHYSELAIQPMQYSMANKLDACQHTIIKYVTRFRDKGGLDDLKKARHVIDMLIELEYGNSAESESGWIEWNGGKCPVPPNTKVEIQYTDNSCIASAVDWSHYGMGGDIKAYRVVK